MSKVIRSFKGKERAKAWVESCKTKYQGKVISGGVYSTGGYNYEAYVFGEITPEMALEMKPRNVGRGHYEYKE